MHFRWLRVIAAFALLCGFTFTSPLNTAFAENTKYQKISLTKWAEENCKVIVNNNTTKNTPFYLEYRNQSDLFSWVMGSYLRHIDTNSDLVLDEHAHRDFISSPVGTDICIRIPGHISPVNSSIASFKSVIYAGVGQTGNFGRINSKNFRIDWTVTRISSPKGIVQKDIEIEELPTNWSNTTVSSQIKYKPLVAGTSLAEDMLMDSEEPIGFSFKSAGIYTLTIQADIRYNGAKNNQLVKTYNLIVGDEATFENQALGNGNTTGSSNSDGGSSIDTSVNPGNTPSPDNDSHSIPNPHPTSDNINNIGDNNNHVDQNNTEKRGETSTNNTLLSTLPGNNIATANQDTPLILGNTNKNITVLNTQPLPVQLGNALIPEEQNTIPAPAEKQIIEAPNNTERQIEAAVSSQNPTVAISRADRTIAQEAGLNFLHTAPLLVAGAVVLVGAGAAATLFLKIKG